MGLNLVFWNLFAPMKGIGDNIGAFYQQKPFSINQAKPETKLIILADNPDPICSLHESKITFSYWIKTSTQHNNIS